MSEFEPVEAGIVAKGPTYVLHPVRGVVWAAFWGTPVAAGIVLAINYWRVGRRSAAQLAVAGGVIATIIIFAIIFAIPDDLSDRIPNAFFYVPQLLLVMFAANQLQAELIRRHASSGGEVASAWPSVGIGVLCGTAVVGLLFAYVLLAEESFGTLVQFGNDDIYYSGEATESDARRLASVLEEHGYFGSGGATVGLKATGGQYTVSFVLGDGAWNRPLTVAEFRGVGVLIAESGFGTPLNVDLCNDFFGVEKTLVVKEVDMAENQQPK